MYTFLVAANNAVQSVKDRADYQCDGMDDELQIQAAIDALSSVGGSVALSEGTFSIRSAYINLSAKSDVSLIGSGWGTIFKMANGVNLSAVINIGSGDRIFLADFQIDGNRANNSRGHGVRALSGHAEDGRIRNLYVHDADNRGISISGDRFQVEGCLLKDCGDSGLGLNKWASGCIIRANEISDCGGDGISCEGSQCLFVGNRCHHTEDTGINIGGIGGHIAEANECYLNANSGINTGGADGSVIVGNICFANGRKTEPPRSNSGIRIRDRTDATRTSNGIVCVGNRCFEDWENYSIPAGAKGQLYGIEIVNDSNGGQPDDLVITGNNLEVVKAAPDGWTPIQVFDIGSNFIIADNLG